MNRVVRLVAKAFDKKVNSIGLSIFRIAYSVVLFCEVLQLRYFKHLIFDPVPFIEVNEIDLDLALRLWLLFIGFITLGLFTRVATIANYLFSVVFIATIHSFEYHMFYAYMGMNFILLFLPVSNSFSIDRIIKRAKFTSAHYTHEPSTSVSVIYYYIPLFVGVGLVYIDSVLYKISSPIWLKGLGMWMPATLPHFNHYGESFVLNNRFSAHALGYITNVFEAVFIFLFWYKPFRIPFLVIGSLLHLGILVFFPIPWFALGVTAIYLLLVPIRWWEKAGGFFKNKRQSITFIYDGECPLCNRTKVILSSLDFFNKVSFITVQKAKSRFQELNGIPDEELIDDIHSIDAGKKVRKGVDTYAAVLIRMVYTAPLGLLLKMPGIYHIAKKIYAKIANSRERVVCTDENCVVSYPVNVDENKKIIGALSLRKIRIALLTLFFVGIVLIQLCVSYSSGIVGKSISASHFDETVAGRALTNFTGKVRAHSHTLLGVTNHPVFMDSHMKNYNHIVALVFIGRNKDIWLPIIDYNGQPDYYVYGFNWVKWTFRVNGPNVNEKLFYNGVKRFTAFWAGKNNVDLNDAAFRILVKKIDIPGEWEKNFLTRQISKPWMTADTVFWKNSEFIANRKNIENL